MLFAEELAALQCRTRWAVMQQPWLPPTLPHHWQRRDEVSDHARIEEATAAVTSAPAECGVAAMTAIRDTSSALRTSVIRRAFQASPTDPSSVNYSAAAPYFPTEDRSGETSTNSNRLPDTAELGAFVEKTS